MIFFNFFNKMKEYSLYYSSDNCKLFYIHSSLYNEYDKQMIQNIITKKSDMKTIKKWLDEQSFLKIYYFDDAILITSNYDIPKYYISLFDNSIYLMYFRDYNIKEEYNNIIKYIKSLEIDTYFF